MGALVEIHREEVPWPTRRERLPCRHDAGPGTAPTRRTTPAPANRSRCQSGRMRTPALIAGRFPRSRFLRPAGRSRVRHRIGFVSPNPFVVMRFPSTP
jgi:hypothetical protein